MHVVAVDLRSLVMRTTGLGHLPRQADVVVRVPRWWETPGPSRGMLFGADSIG
jgi:hypothetical protein